MLLELEEGCGSSWGQCDENVGRGRCRYVAVGAEHTTVAVYAFFRILYDNCFIYSRLLSFMTIAVILRMIFFIS